MLSMELKAWLQSWRIRRSVRTRFPSTVIEERVTIKGDPGNLQLGENVVIQSGSVLHLGGAEWCRNSGHLEIGDNGVVSPNCVLYGCGPGGLRIGHSFDCGPGVVVVSMRTEYGRRSEPRVFGPVVIGNNVTIYSNAVVGPNVSIGDNAAIAACSVVTSDLPADSLVGGTPARVISASHA